MYIGKLDNKKQKSIGLYGYRQERVPYIPLGGSDRASYTIKGVSILVHWSKSLTESEIAAYRLYKKLLEAGSPTIGGVYVHFIRCATEMLDVGTSEDGVYEFALRVEFICESEE